MVGGGPQKSKNGHKLHLGRTKVAREGSVPVGHLGSLGAGDAASDH